MKRSIIALACLLTAAAFAGAQTVPGGADPADPMDPAGPADPFADIAALAGESLDAAALAAVSGDGINFFVNRATQTMAVLTYSGSSPTSDYSSLRSYSVPVTTAVVRRSDLSGSLTRDALVNPNKAIPISGKTDAYYNPTQFPSGTYNIICASKPTEQQFGPMQLRTDAAPVLPTLNKKGAVTGTFVDGGYNIHLTPFGNTNGCVGVQNPVQMTRIVSDYQRNGVGSVATIKVF